MIPAILTIAGSDSGGGAGIQADLRAFRSFHTYGCSAITALTAQNPVTVNDIMPVSAEMVTSQIKTVMDAIDIKAIKTGMLFSVEIVEAVCDILKDLTIPVVVDPVMISTGGSPLLKPEARCVVREKLLPLASWFTPNIPEAEHILQCKIQSADDMIAATEQLQKRYHNGVILKGGHMTGCAGAADVVCSPEGTYILSSPRLDVLPYAAHGTGCSFSAAFAAALGSGMSCSEALVQSKSFLYESLRRADMISGTVAGMPPALFIPFPTKEITLEKQ
ncbi:MAG: bifunctional hydroxymethylpyrimidine kinase/phosphomethylpyrimidine kinase [Lentisphaeria bacterium]|nr:bifunctional hydroxymethylpyrimidine kinase/phosphomethylpyrimidine kinase [Lentisphaeria bacterium]